MTTPQDISVLLNHLAAYDTYSYLEYMRILLEDISSKYPDKSLIYILDVSKDKAGQATINTNQYVFANNSGEAIQFLKGKLSGLSNLSLFLESSSGAVSYKVKTSNAAGEREVYIFAFGNPGLDFDDIRSWLDSA